VQAAINAAHALLPTGLPINPTYRKVNPADAPILILSLTSETMSRAELYDVASTVMAQKLAQIKGIGQVTIGGSSLPGVRVELDPKLMTQNNIGFADVSAAISAANTNRPKGIFESGERSWQILTINCFPFYNFKLLLLKFLDPLKILLPIWRHLSRSIGFHKIVSIGSTKD
jgi:multidrug efflux pump